MSSNASLAVRLYGTEEPVEPPRILRAGALTAELEAGNLRYIRYRGHELLRAVSFIVRDRNWGTYNPEITDLRIDQDFKGFEVNYDAVCRDAEQAFAYRTA
jgi:D-apionolactonase